MNFYVRGPSPCLVGYFKSLKIFKAFACTSNLKVGPALYSIIRKTNLASLLHLSLHVEGFRSLWVVQDEILNKVLDKNLKFEVDLSAALNWLN